MIMADGMTAVADGVAAVADGMVAGTALAHGMKMSGVHMVIPMTREAANGKSGEILRI